jgi:hypothetical protein
MLSDALKLVNGLQWRRIIPWAAWVDCGGVPERFIAGNELDNIAKAF